MTSTLHVCETCAHPCGTKSIDGETGGARLAAMVERLAGDAPEVEVRRHACLMGCERHCNVSVSAPGKIGYVIGRFTPDEGAAQAILDYARLHAASETGQVPYREWPQGVKGHFTARIPAVGAEG